MKIALASTVLLIMEGDNLEPILSGSGFIIGIKVIAADYHLIESASIGWCHNGCVVPTHARREGSRNPQLDRVLKGRDIGGEELYHQATTLLEWN